MSDFPWAYIDKHSSLSASGPTGSVQFRSGDTGGFSNITGSDNFMFHTASGVLAISGTVEVVGTASANQLNVLSQSVVTTNFSASGDTVFGNTTDDIHQFTGSVNIGGALSASGEIFAAGDADPPKSAFRLSGPITATSSIKNQSFISSSGEVYGTSLRASGRTLLSPDGLSVSGSITGSSFISSSGEIFSAGGFRNSGTGDSNIAFSGTLNNKSFISSSGETFAVGGLRTTGSLGVDGLGLHVSGSTDFKHSKAATDYTSISGTFEVTGAADSLIVLHTQDTDVLKEIAFKKAGTTQTSIGIDSDEHFIIENESTKDIILRTQNQNTIRIFGNQQAVEINGAGVTANATLDVNGDTTITGSLTVSGTIAFGDRRRPGVEADSTGLDVLFISGTLTASKGIHFGEAAADPILIPLDKKIMLTGSALNASASFVSSSNRHFSISGSVQGGTILRGGKLTLDHEDPALSNLFNESGIVLSGAVGGPSSYLGVNDAGQIALTSALAPLPGQDQFVLYNKDGVFSASAGFTIDYDDNELSQAGTFEIKSGSSPASAPVIFEVDGEDGIQGGRTRGKFYHVYSVNFSLTSNAQSNKGRFLPWVTGDKGHVGLGAGVDPYYNGALTNTKSILNPSSGRVIMLMWRFEGNYNSSQALANPPLFFMRVGSILGNGIAGNSFTGTEDADGTSAIHSVTASAHPGQYVVGGIDFRTGVGALTGFANITGSWSFGTGSLMNLHIRTPSGGNAPGAAYLTIVCEYDHLTEYVSGSGN